MATPTPEHPEIALRICLPSRALLVVAGLPGAGKSTLLRATHADRPITVLDTDQVRDRLAARFPDAPYCRYRALVHLLAQARVLAALVRAAGPVVVHDPATGSVARAVLVILGVVTGRPRHLLWLDCPAGQARTGQRDRGRVVLGWTFARHTRAAARLRSRLLTGLPPRGWTSITITDRSQARNGLLLHVEPHSSPRHTGENDDTDRTTIC